MIFVLSARHTGTWTLISYLCAHKEVDGFQQIERFGIEGKHHQLRDDCFLVERMGANMVVHTHINAVSAQFAPLLSTFAPIVMPLRDPLAAVITKNNRGDMGSDETFIDDWARSVSVARHAHVVAVDHSPEWFALSENLGMMPVAPPCRGNASGYPLIGRRGWYRGHESYDNRDIPALKRLLGKAWDYLKSKEGELRPFLESQGYRSLMWWS